ncbi:MAG TPA: hypothetical protein VF691_11200 [Cytophagaceae bacterium]
MKTRFLIPFMFASTVALGQNQTSNGTCEVKPPYSREYYCGKRGESQPMNNLWFSPSTTWAWKQSPVLKPADSNSLSATKERRNHGKRFKELFNFDWRRNKNCDGKSC